MSLPTTVSTSMSYAVAATWVRRPGIDQNGTQERSSGTEAKFDSLKNWDTLTSYPDILRRIFIYCLPMGHEPTNKDAAPLLLTRICHYWRRLAMETPQMWSRIVLVLKETDVKSIDDFKKYKDALESWLERSKNCPLDAAICASFAAHRAFLPSLSELYLLLKRHQNRWRKIRLELPASVLWSDSPNGIMDVSSSTLKLLSVILTPRKETSRVTRPVLLASQSCGDLKWLYLVGPGAKVDMSRLPPNIEGIVLKEAVCVVRHLMLGTPCAGFDVDFTPCAARLLRCIDSKIGLAVLHSLYRALPNLRELWITHHNRDLEAQAVYDMLALVPVEMRFVGLLSLHRLCLFMQRWSLLDYFVTPRLSELFLVEDCSGALTDLSWPRLTSERLQAFIHRSRLALTVLKLASVTITEEGLIEALRCMPELEDLEINLYSRQLSDDLLFALSLCYPGRRRQVPGRTILDECMTCPLLKKLVIRPCTNSYHRFTAPFVHKLIYSRKILSPAVTPGGLLWTFGWEALTLSLYIHPLSVTLQWSIGEGVGNALSFQARANP